MYISITNNGSTSSDDFIPQYSSHPVGTSFELEQLEKIRFWFASKKLLYSTNVLHTPNQRKSHHILAAEQISSKRWHVTHTHTTTHIFRCFLMGFRKRCLHPSDLIQNSSTRVVGENLCTQTVSFFIWRSAIFWRYSTHLSRVSQWCRQPKERGSRFAL